LFQAAIADEHHYSAIVRLYLSSVQLLSDRSCCLTIGVCSGRKAPARSKPVAPTGGLVRLDLSVAPVGGSTREFYAWSDQDVRRCFGHFEAAGQFVIDRLGDHL
jgi:hypothetical protein